MNNGVVIVGPASPRLLLGDATTDDVPAGLGGTPVNDLVRGLVAAGVEVELVTTSYDVTAPWRGERGLLQVTVAPGRASAKERALDLFAFERRGLTRALEGTQGSVVHAHWTYEFALAALGGTRPVVVTAHDAPLTILRHMPDPYRLARTAMAVWARTRIKHLTAVSPYLAERWRRELGYRRRIAIVPNAVEIAASRLRSPGSGRVRLLEVADASRRKNVPTLISAFARLRASREDVELILVGPGLADADDLAVQTRAAGLGRSVNFRGPLGRDELAQAYAAADIFVHASAEEACPMVVLEAMAWGLPVIGGYRSGGVPWVLDDGRAGMLVDVRRSDQLAQAMRQILADDARRAHLSAAGIARARVFSPAAMVDAYLEEYDRLVSGRAG